MNTSTKARYIISKTLKFPLSTFKAGVYEDQLCLFDFEYRKMMPAITSRIEKDLTCGFTEGEHPLFTTLWEQVNEYFLGKLTLFRLPLLMTGTDFQKAVWRSLLNIPFGKTIAYKQLAQNINNANAVKAVASANGQNCFAIIVPCHRVIGLGGALTGYAGGLAAKKWLLSHERQGVSTPISGSLF